MAGVPDELVRNLACDSGGSFDGLRFRERQIGSTG